MEVGILFFSKSTSTFLFHSPPPFFPLFFFFSFFFSFSLTCFLPLSLNSCKAVDVKGRLWCGSTADGDTSKTTHSGALYRLDPDGTVRTIPTGLEHIKIPNGLGWSPDNLTFYMSDSLAGRIYAWNFDPEAGSIANPRLLQDLSAEGLEPDGMCVDAEGCLWWAVWGGGKIIRFSPDGATRLAEVIIPVERVTCASFGGPAMDQLYVTTAKGDVDNSESLAGDVFCVNVGVKGLPKFKFGG